MRTVTYGGACSLDGFIAGADGSLDWLHFSRDVNDVMRKYWATIDTVLMGRKTWQAAVAQGGGESAAEEPPPPPRSRRRKPSSGPVTYVFSRTLRTLSRPGAQLVSGDAAEFVRELKQQPGEGICVMGGGELAQSLFEADLIDEVGFNIHPILLGTGVPAFRDPGHRISLELTESRVIDGGCVLVTYRVRHRVATASSSTTAATAAAAAAGRRHGRGRHGAQYA